MYKILLKKLGSKSGQALILASVIIAFLIILPALLQKVITGDLSLQRQRLEKEVFYLAEGGMEDAMYQFSSAIANFQIDVQVPLDPTPWTITTSYSASAPFPGATVSSSIIEASDLLSITDPDGLNYLMKAYKITSSCQHPKNSTVTATLNQIIFIKLRYAFQHSVFYASDLELLPGAIMTFTGRIHSNKDIYIGSDGATLTINSDHLYTAGNIYNRRKDGSGSVSGRVRIKIKDSDPPAYANMAGLDSNSPNWATQSQTRWNGTVKSSVHDVPTMATPIVRSIEPGGYYDSQSEVRIENGTIKRGGVTLQEGVDIPVGTIRTNDTLYNYREGKYIRMTNIDLKKLAGYATGDAEGLPSFPNNLPSNGLIYATRNDTPVTKQPGVRLVNGGKIYPNPTATTSGLTIVSNDPVYIQGDYNTIDRQQSAVICDAVNILSNTWDDSHSRIGSRVAGNTTVNTAFIAGIKDTASGDYNGGLENYPRLLENWTGKSLNITGSFVALWNSQIAQGHWRDAQYSPPNRNWFYDTTLADSEPPFTPWAVEVERGAWWKG